MRYLLLLLFPLQAFAAYTEFYVQTTASNLNAGSTTNDTATYTSVNGNWNGTAIFTPTDGSTPASTVNVGDWASVYIDGATVGVCSARITTVAAGANGAITVSTTAKGGTVPTSSATGRSIKVGGAWKGPAAAVVTIPFAIMNGAMTDTATNTTRVNFKNGVTYNMTLSLSCGGNGPMKVAGYTTTPGDGGRVTFDGGNVASTFAAGSFSGSYVDWEDMIFNRNGAAGTPFGGLSISGVGAFNTFRRIAVSNMVGPGINSSESGCTYVECEVFGSTTAGIAHLANDCLFDRCVVHDNTTIGFSQASTSSGMLVNCIFDSNTTTGMTIAGSTRNTAVIGCEFYNNGSHGVDLTATGSFCVYFENCNFIKNGGWGFTSSGSLLRNGMLVNCGFGSGTQANTSGDVSTTAAHHLPNLNSITYAANSTPWSDPANGDFRINLLAAKNTGRGFFLETQSGYTNTISYPNIGASQHYAPVSGGSYSFAQ